MNIALCTDENFTIPALVCLTSIFENNKDDDCHVYVLTDGISDKAKEKFTKLSVLYNQNIDIMIIDKHRFDGLTVNERFPISIYYRFLLPEMLPVEHKMLYIDCDIIVRHSLKELYNTNIDQYALAAIVSQTSDNLSWTNYLKLNSLYFNSGVLLLNLDFWRNYNITDNLINWTYENPQLCNMPDQNALNKVLEDKVVYLDYTYNFQENWFGDLTNAMHYSKWDEIRKVAQDPVIVHFCNDVKPWFKECTNPFHEEYLRYAFMYDFIDFHLIKRYGKFYYFTTIVDRIGLKFRWWAELLQKKLLRGIAIS